MNANLRIKDKISSISSAQLDPILKDHKIWNFAVKWLVQPVSDERVIVSVYHAEHMNSSAFMIRDGDLKVYYKLEINPIHLKLSCFRFEFLKFYRKSPFPSNLYPRWSITQKLDHKCSISREIRKNCIPKFLQTITRSWRKVSEIFLYKIVLYYIIELIDIIPVEQQTRRVKKYSKRAFKEWKTSKG